MIHFIEGFFTGTAVTIIVVLVGNFFYEMKHSFGTSNDSVVNQKTLDRLKRD